MQNLQEKPKKKKADQKKKSRQLFTTDGFITLDTYFLR